MPTISVPLSAELGAKLDHLVKQGVARTKSEVMRKALELLAEQEAVNAVLQAEKEPVLRGDLRRLMKKMK